MRNAGGGERDDSPSCVPQSAVLSQGDSVITNSKLMHRYSSYIFNAGHSIGVSVTSSNYPKFTANLNNGHPLSDPVSHRDVVECLRLALAVRP